MENDFYVKNRGRRGLSSYTPFTSTVMCDDFRKPDMFDGGRDIVL